MIFTIGENMNIRRFEVIEGVTSAYIHGAGTTGVVVKFNADAAVAEKPEFAAFAKNIALQIAAGSPPAYVCRDEVPASALEEEKAVLLAQIKNDEKNANKPEAILEKIAEGKMRKFFEENTLLNQAVVGEKISIREFIESADKEATVVAYKRFALEA